MNITTANKQRAIILCVWILIFASDPLYMYYAHLANDFEFEWNVIFRLWTYTTVYLVLFLLHHYLLVPILTVKKQTTIYATCVFACMMALFAFLVWGAPDNRRERIHQRPMPKESYIQHNMHINENMLTVHDLKNLNEPDKDVRRKRTRPNHKQENRPILAPPDLCRLVMVLLMMIADLGLVAWFNEQKMKERLLQLETQNLKQELEHLRYQINPHFFMNTLNNIHALIDIDQERAKRSIVELSRLMRYSLYEGNGPLAQISQEVEFINLYISLMRMRYTDKLKITCELPTQNPAGVMMPPMLLATFVENAFKHGVSYQAPSFIHVKLALENDNHQIHFRCLNSKHPTNTSTQDGHHGIGLENVRKRLDLQYADNYTLTIDNESDNIFSVDLTIDV